MKYLLKSSNYFVLFSLILLFQACQDRKEIHTIDSVNWKKRTVDYLLPDSLTYGTTYLSVYSQIYSVTEQRKHNLTVTVSLRNTNIQDTIYIEKADFYDTKGKKIRSYFDKTIFVAPLETVEIIIEEGDESGGTGANFLFDWRIENSSQEPFFEGVMISTSGQQGLSFTTRGQRVK